MPKLTHKYVEQGPKGKYGEHFKILTHYHSHLKNIRWISGHFSVPHIPDFPDIAQFMTTIGETW